MTTQQEPNHEEKNNSSDINWDKRIKETFLEAFKEELQDLTNTLEVSPDDKNDFPYEVLPTLIQRYVVEAHQHLNYPLDYMMKKNFDDDDENK